MSTLEVSAVCRNVYCKYYILATVLERKVQYQLPKILSFFLVDYSPTATYNTMNVFQERLCAFNPLI